MILARKIRIRPNKEQEHQLWRSVGTARWAYNWTLGKQEENHKHGGTFLSDGILRKELTVLKQPEEYAWLYEVSNNITKQAIKDACEAYKRFFKGLANKPRFKSRRKSKPSFYNDNVKLKVRNNEVLIEKVGWMKTSELLPIDVKYTNPRIHFDGKYWYLSIGVEKEKPQQKLTSESLGIDVGMKELAMCSNGMKFKNINKTKAVKQVEKLQLQVSRKYEMNREGIRFVKTSNIIKLEKKIQLLHRHLTNVQDNHIHQVTTAIVKTKPCRIVVKMLNIKEIMKNKHLSKAIAQQKLYDFKIKIQYKCEKYGIEYIKVDKWFPSSKMCSSCGEIKKTLRLSKRIYTCDCGHETDRDLNASINLSRYQLAN
ncbi:IS605 OrfB family transposase [Bacillus cereus VD196]|uniref:IS605 OrfB family transposase n=1 Tax=Bacillus cereus VD196 TaxID=1053243 RepID=A0A9W5V5W0_BACCE|nr:RNA-guided endonuclease TnpB family protein [Bacillus cereus]EOO60751.1 IS605 OrfB family transposase [Bacillus cereus VD196]